MVIPNPPEDLQVVPDIALEEEKEKHKEKEKQGSCEIERKPFLSTPDNGERTSSSSVSSLFIFIFCHIQ